MFLCSPSLRSFSSQECSFPQESYLLSSARSAVTFFHLAIFSLSQPSNARAAPFVVPSPSVPPASLSPFVSPPPGRAVSLLISFLLSVPPFGPSPLSCSPVSRPRGEQKLRIREAFVESHAEREGSIEGFRSRSRGGALRSLSSSFSDAAEPTVEMV